MGDPVAKQVGKLAKEIVVIRGQLKNASEEKVKKLVGVVTKPQMKLLETIQKQQDLVRDVVTKGLEPRIKSVEAQGAAGKQMAAQVTALSATVTALQASVTQLGKELAATRAQLAKMEKAAARHS